MTVLTKFGASEKKDQLPLVDENSQNEAKIEVNDEIPPEDMVQNFIIIRKKPDARLSHLCCIVLTALLVTSIGIIGGMQIYIQINKQSVHRYQGWCAIPYDNNNEPKLIEPHFRITPIPPPFFSANSRDVELLEDLPRALQRQQQTDDLPNYKFLKETFDIGDDFERIIVSEHIDGRQTNFIHDFKSNFSGIVDTDRCFVMSMNSSLVMPPGLLVSNIQDQADFDLTTVHNIMRAIMPALADFSNLGRRIGKDCSDRPTYLLKLQPEGAIRKRSADIPTYAKFAQFSGKHVQEIDIDNINELLAYEEKLANLI